MSEPHVVFDSAVEALFVHGLRGQVSPALKSKLKALGLDLEKKLRPAYERALWAKALAVTAQEIYPGAPIDQAARQMGLHVSRGFNYTVVGKATIAFSQVIGPRRMLGRLTRSLGSANTYVAANVVDRAPRDVEIHCAGLDLSPYFMGGILEAALEFCKAKSPSVVVQSSTDDQAVFRVTWSE